MRRLYLLSFWVTLWFFFLGLPICIGEETSLTVIYTSNTLGEVEPCITCPESGGNGGLARRAQFIKIAKQEGKSIFVFDSGNALAIDYFRQVNEREKARKRAVVVIQIYEKIGYDALNIGDIDLGLGIEYLKNIQKRVKFPFLSANLRERKTGRPVFCPYIIKEVGSAKIGIIGLLTTFFPSFLQKEIKHYFVEDPIKTALRLVNGPVSHCNYIFALAHLSYSEIESLAQRIPEISLIIGGRDRSFIFPKKIGKTLVVQTDAFGFHVGKINLKLLKRSLDWIDILPRTLLSKNIEEIQKKIEEAKDRIEKENLIKIKENLIEQANRLSDSRDRNRYENIFALMHPKMESDKEIELFIESNRNQLKRPIPY
ncbi:MAG: hypothetical protein ACUVQ9_00520 [Thermodesulfobacteriota bacterium]